MFYVVEGPMAKAEVMSFHSCRTFNSGDLGELTDHSHKKSM